MKDLEKQVADLRYAVTVAHHTLSLAGGLTVTDCGESWVWDFTDETDLLQSALQATGGTAVNDPRLPFEKIK